MEYLLIWDIDDYPESGGGVDYQFFENILELEDFVNKKCKDDRFKIYHALHIDSEMEVEPVEKIVKWQVKN